MLSRTVTFQGLKAISRWDLQVLERNGGVQDCKLLERRATQANRQSATNTRLPQLLCVAIAKTRYHVAEYILTHRNTIVMQQQERSLEELFDLCQLRGPAVRRQARQEDFAVLLLEDTIVEQRQDAAIVQ